jgi:carbon monoxide dehydrogenase subunit G
MNIEGTHTFAATRDTVWPMLLDPEVLASVMPGCEKLEQVGENQYKGILKIRVGPVQGKFDGIVTLTDIDAPESYRMDVKGKGAPGFVNGNGSLQLLAEDGTTVLRYKGTAQVGGRIASVGQRLLDTSARAIVRQSLEGLDKQVQARVKPAALADPDEASIASPVGSPSELEFTLGVLKNMVEDLVPEQTRRKLTDNALPILGLFLLLLIIDGWRMNRLARRVAKRMRK